MSSYSDFANAASDILLKKGEAQARAKERSGELWGGTIANLGQVIPQQVQDVLKQRAEQRKAQQINQIFQESGGNLEQAIPRVMGIDPELGSKLLKQHAEIRRDALEWQKLDWERKKYENELDDRMLGTINDEDSYARYVIAQKEAGRDVSKFPPQYDPAWVKQQKIARLSFKDQLELDNPTKKLERVETVNPEGVAGVEFVEPTPGAFYPSAPKPGELVPVPGPDNKPVYGQKREGQPVYEKPSSADGMSGPEADEQFRQIMMKPPAQRTPDESAWASAYRLQKTMVPTATFQMNAPVRQDARTDRGYTNAQRELDAVRKPIVERAERLARLNDALNQQTPQADALLAPELLSVMAGGQGSGLRMNEAEIARIIGGRSNWESLKAKLNQWSIDPSKALSVTPAQRQQMRNLVRSVQTRTTTQMQALDKAYQDLIDADTVEQQRQIIATINKQLTSAVIESPAPAPTGGVPGFSYQDYLKSRQK